MGGTASSAKFVVDASGGEGSTHRSLEEAWKAAVASGATRIELIVRGGTYDTAGELTIDLSGREVEIAGEGPVVLRTRRPKEEGVLKFVGNAGKVLVRDVALVGTVFLRSWKSEWTFERCDLSGENFCCLYCVGGTLGYDGVGAKLTVRRCRVQKFGRKEGICFKAASGQLLVEDCEIASGRCGVSVGGLAGCSAEVLNCHIRDCQEEGVRLLKPCAGRAEGNTVWACATPVLFTDGLANACTPFSDFSVEKNALHASNGPPPRVEPLETGPRQGGIMASIATKVESGLQTIKRDFEETVDGIMAELDQATEEERRKDVLERGSSVMQALLSRTASGPQAAAAARADERLLRSDPSAVAGRTGSTESSASSASRASGRMSPHVPAAVQGRLSSSSGTSGSPHGKLLSSSGAATGSPHGSRSRDPRRWSPSDVAAWLHEIKFGEYSTLFINSNVGGRGLLRMDEAGLRAVGVREAMHAFSLLQSIRELVEASNPPPATSAAPSSHSPSQSPSGPLAPAPSPPPLAPHPPADPNAVEKRFDCFVSYAHKDKDAVFKYVDRLQQSGVTVWIDRMQLTHGDNWMRVIGENIAASKTFLCFLSPRYFESGNCEDELSYAHKLRLPKLPLWLGAARPEIMKHDHHMMLATVNWVEQRDESERAFEGAFNSLLCGIKLKRAEGPPGGPRAGLSETR